MSSDDDQHAHDEMDEERISSETAMFAVGEKIVVTGTVSTEQCDGHEHGQVEIHRHSGRSASSGSMVQGAPAAPGSSGPATSVAQNF
jgi:hypothetical protein